VEPDGVSRHSSTSGSLFRDAQLGAAAMQEIFRYLIEGFCKFCGLDNPGRILDGGSIVVNEVTFSLIYSENINPELLFIYCDFGDAPLGRQSDAYRALLEANLYLYSGSGPAFSISRETGRVVFADQYRLDNKSTPEELHAILVRLAEKAQAWRADHFLGKSPRGAVRSSPGRPPGLNR
jgi:hypothetical protein